MRPERTTTLIVREDGAMCARARLYERRDLVGLPGLTGVVGEFEADDPEAGTQLLHAACRRFAARGAKRVVGPMNGDTWHAYRVVLPPEEQPAPPGGMAWPPFPGEPTNPPEAAAIWRAAGFDVMSHYESAVVLDLAAASMAHGSLEPPAGVLLRPLDPKRQDDELDLLFAASLHGFARNPWYAPIGRVDFRALYEPLLPIVDPAFVEIAEAEASRRVLGFLLCYAWPGMKVDGKPVLIAKTIAVVPEARGQGLGRLLFARAHARAAERGFAAVVHALMHVDNLSTRLSAGRHGEVFRRYALFGRTP